MFLEIANFVANIKQPILEKNHMDAKVVTKASVAETSQSIFFRIFNFAANIQQGPILEKNHKGAKDVKNMF